VLLRRLEPAFGRRLERVLEHILHAAGQPGSDLVGLGLKAAATAAPPAPTLSATYSGPTSATLAWGTTAQAPHLPTSSNIMESTHGVTFATVATTDGQATGFTNAGLFKKSAGTGSTYVTTAITNTSTGTVQAQAGTLSFEAGGTSAGAVSVAAPLSP